MIQIPMGISYNAARLIVLNLVEEFGFELVKDWLREAALFQAETAGDQSMVWHSLANRLNDIPDLEV